MSTKSSKNKTPSGAVAKTVILRDAKTGRVGHRTASILIKRMSRDLQREQALTDQAVKKEANRRGIFGFSTSTG